MRDYVLVNRNFLVCIHLLPISLILLVGLLALYIKRFLCLTNVTIVVARLINIALFDDIPFDVSIRANLLIPWSKYRRREPSLCQFTIKLKQEGGA